MQQPVKSSMFATLILGGLFVIFGFVTWLNGTLIQYLKIACQLNSYRSFFIASAFYASYFFLALPSSWILKKTGFKKGMMLGLFIMALGALLFIPAAKTRMYQLFLTGQFIIGVGLCILQTASNPYVTIVGPIESAAKRISIMGICNKVSGILAPIILSTLVLKDASTLQLRFKMALPADKDSILNELASRVILPYSCMALVLVVLGLAIWFSPLPEVETEDESVNNAIDTGTIETGAIDAAEITGRKTKTGNRDRNNVFQYPNLILGVLALFLYVGAEVIAGDTIGPYGGLSGISLAQTRFFTSFTLMAMVAGYLIGIFTIPQLISQSKALAISAIAALLITLLAISTRGYVSVGFVALLGLANAIMWPAIWPLSLSGLGRFTKTGSAMLIMAILGGAVLPPLWGYFADYFVGPRLAYTILMPGYLFILFYSVKGYKISKW